MNDETITFFAKYCFQEVSAKDFSDWAIYCLEQGIDSKNIRILASMFNTQSISEVKTYFIRSLDDLNLNYPIAEKCLPEYANLIAKQILDKKIEAIKGCREIYKVYRELNYDKQFQNWDFLDGGMHPETYEDLVFERNGVEHKHLLEEAIIEEALKMIYGKKTTVHQIKAKPDFEFAEERNEGLFSKLWKRIF
jgi:hypothetical protein